MKNSLILLGIVLFNTASPIKNCDAATVTTSGPVKAPAQTTTQTCREHIEKEEKSKGIEPGLLEAIAQIESKLAPYTVNASGDGYSFKTVEAAVQFIKAKKKQGCRNISVGPMQLQLRWHQHNFKSIEEMIEPQKNISYAAKLLAKFKRQTGSMEKAVKMYHTGNPHTGEAYKERVFNALAKIRIRKARSNIQPVSAKVTPSVSKKSKKKSIKATALVASSTP